MRPSTLRSALILAACLVPVAGCRRRPEALAAARQQAGAGPGRHDRDPAKRPALLRPHERRARASRAVPARREDRLGLRGRRSARPRAHARAHGVQRHARTSSRTRWSPISKRPARGSVRTSTRTRRSTDTMYMLQVASDKPGRWSTRALLALSDFAGGMTLDPKEIDKERGVVIEEWRLGQGAGSRLMDKQAPVALLPLALRGAAAHRHAGDPAHVHAARGCATSTRPGTGPIAWPLSSSATSTRRRSWRPSR